MLSTILLAASLAQESPPSTKTDTAEYIMQRVLSKIEENRIIRDASIRYQKRLITEDLGDEKKGPQIKKVEIFSVFVRDGVPVQILIVENGKPLKKPKEKSPRIDLDRALQGRYQVKLSSDPLRIDEATGRLFYHLDFSPLDNPPQDLSNEDAMLNRLSGTLVIDSEHWCIVRLDGSLTKSFKIGGIFPVVECTISLVMQHIYDSVGQHIVLPDHIVVTLHYWKPSLKVFSEVYERETSIYGPIEFISQSQSPPQ